MVDFEIRLAAIDDLESVEALYQHLHPDDPPFAAAEERVRAWTRMLKQPGFFCLVGRTCEGVVASCCLAILPNLTRGGRPYGVIENVVTHGEFRRRGFGRAVVVSALETAWEQHCYKVMLLSGSRRPEIKRFYEKCGFSADEKIGLVARPRPLEIQGRASDTASTRAELARRIASRSQLRGEFRLRSGAVSTDYFDKYQFESDPALLRTITEELVSLLPKGTEVLAGLELGGVPIATGLSFHSGLPVVFVRKQPKAYGTCRLAEGGDVNGRRLLIVEDVVTSGGQVVESTIALRGLGATVEHAVCVIDRESGGPENLQSIGVRLTSLFRRNELE